MMTMTMMVMVMVMMTMMVMMTAVLLWSAVSSFVWEAAFATDELMQTADRGREAMMMKIMMVMLMMAGDGDDGSPAYFHHY